MKAQGSDSGDLQVEGIGWLSIVQKGRSSWAGRYSTFEGEIKKFLSVTPPGFLLLRTALGASFFGESRPSRKKDGNG